MFDAPLRKLIDPPLNQIASSLVKTGIGANAITLLGVIFAIGCGFAIAFHAYGLALFLAAINRCLDGLDGAIARAKGPTDFGGYLDIVCDYVFYIAVPIGFALADPSNNAVPAAAVLASFCLTASSYLAFATLAAKRGVTTKARGQKSYYAAFGMIEGSETIAFFAAFLIWPTHFPSLAFVLAGLCILTTVARVKVAQGVFKEGNE
ncbi:CDP-alcohol phosphatidyltransferase family protein [Aquidulcibacter paucihalophilus]|uniref:CDP-alcohol phosphatidyltransferase family protein n=1 Tax=Aquidulcibacter paucihalophilus TaxID=1978549 RepID=UPI000A19726A|nr:CDP-alcohol phosphatidyltransferase family protein [Aquidulcibacter paucihalophilus]